MLKSSNPLFLKKQTKVLLSSGLGGGLTRVCGGQTMKSLFAYSLHISLPGYKFLTSIKVCLRILSKPLHNSLLASFSVLWIFVTNTMLLLFSCWVFILLVPDLGTQQAIPINQAKKPYSLISSYTEKKLISFYQLYCIWGYTPYIPTYHKKLFKFLYPNSS